MAVTGVSIRPSSTVFFYVPTCSAAPVQPKDNRAKGGRKSAIRMRRTMEFFWLFAKEIWGYGKDEQKRFKFKIAFITLTLSSPQQHTDDFIKAHMLEPFLKWAFREGKDSHYVWKAETQANGNIHFHITFNGFIHYLKIRQKWNHLQWKHGYISATADPNSTDVHSVKHTKGFVGYMAKYMSKVNEESGFNRPDDLFPFDYQPLEREVMMLAIGEGGMPFYRRKVEGKQWACDRRLLNCSAKIVYRDDLPEEQRLRLCGDLQEVWDSHLRMMRCDVLRTPEVVLWKHERDINLNTKLTPVVAELFSKAYESYIGLS